MATIYEVAALAGVSPATVSRVVNGQRVSEEKSVLVRKAAADLNFTPNRTARTLRRQNSEVIALVLPDIENPYFTSMARGVEDAAQEAGYSVVLCNTDEDPAKEAKYLDIAISENMAGLEHLIAKGRPIVAVDRSTGFDIDGVMMNNRQGGTSATDTLYTAGYRRIACITGPKDIETAKERAVGWREVVQEHAMFERPEEYLRYSTFRVDGGRSAMAELLALPEPPDAVVATNNLMGVGALQLLTETGLTPPRFGVAVVGDLPFTTLSPNVVSIVRLPVRHMGVTAARMLIERINGDTQPARTVVLRYEVVPATALPVAAI
jgi:LacI family transcriptional regulator